MLVHPLEIVRMKTVIRLLHTDAVNMFNIESYVNNTLVNLSEYERKETVRLFKHVWEEYNDSQEYRDVINSMYASAI